MNANPNNNTDFIRDSIENVQSHVEEVASTLDIEEHQQSESETDFVNSDSEYIYSDTDLSSDVNQKKKDPTLSIAPKPVESKRKPTYQQN